MLHAQQLAKSVWRILFFQRPGCVGATKGLEVVVQGFMIGDEVYI
jgi:hypothetical protein